MANFAEQMQNIFQAYTDELGSEPVSLDAVAEWAIAKGMFYPTPRSVLKLCREALADSLRQEKRLDDAGRWYRAKHPVRKNVGGVQLTLWADMADAPRVHMEESFAQRRKSISNDCYQIKQDVDHFNEHRAADKPIQMILDFTDDVAEMEAVRGLDRDDEAA